jgi:hypothetical protein
MLERSTATDGGSVTLVDGNPSLTTRSMLLVRVALALLPLPIPAFLPLLDTLVDVAYEQGDHEDEQSATEANGPPE